MNQINPSMLPTAPTEVESAAPATIQKQDGEEGESFDALLQQSSEESADAPILEEPPEPSASTAAPEASTQAEIAAVSGLPAIALPVEATPLRQQDSDFHFAIESSDKREIASATADGPQREARSAFPPERATAKVDNIFEILRPIQTEGVAATAPALTPVAPPVVSVSSANHPDMGGAEPALSAGANVISPANSVTKTAEMPGSLIAKPAPDSQPIPTTQLPSEAVVAISHGEKSNGMPAAKPGHDMSAPTPQRSQRPSPATSAQTPPGDAPSAPVTIAETHSFRAVPVLAANHERESLPQHHDANADRSPAVTPDISPANFSSDAARTFSANPPAAPVRAADLAQVVTQTLQATERLLANGGERVDVALKLEGGQELTIRLRVVNGEVMPTIRTDSEPLRLALEQNWSNLTQRGGDRELRITTPIFESSQTSSNMSDPNQQRDGRQRAFNEPATDFFNFQNARRGAPGGSPRTTTLTPTPDSGVRLYA